MSLPSQTGRSGGFRTSRFSVSRKRGKPAGPRLLLALAAVALVGLVWFWWPASDGDANTSDGLNLTVAAEDNARSSAAPLTRGQAPDPEPPLNGVNGTNAPPSSDQRRSTSPTPSFTMGDPAGPTNATPTPEPQRRDAAPPPRPADRPADRPDEPLTRPGREVTPSGPAPTTDRPSTDADSPISSLLAEADGALADGRPAIAREVLNRALHHRAATAAERAYLRDRLQQLADILTFSTRVVPGDAMVREYAVQSGDFLSTIARREGVRTDWRFIQRINDMDNPNRLHVGQDLKLVQGPFHAVVDKSDYRLDLYADDRDSAGNRLFLASFNVGLGEFNSTPSGRWVVKNRLENPGWTNPRDGRESYGPDDPQNPIGEYWVGLDGVDDHNRAETGIGLHGTIEPDTIGQQASMGCVRLLPNDIQLLYEVLIPGESEVVIRD